MKDVYRSAANGTLDCLAVSLHIAFFDIVQDLSLQQSGFGQCGRIGIQHHLVICAGFHLLDEGDASWQAATGGRTFRTGRGRDVADQA